jgi:hypothetical protein
VLSKGIGWHHSGVKGKIAGTVGFSSRGSGECDRRRRDVILSAAGVASDAIIYRAAKLNGFGTACSDSVHAVNAAQKALELGAGDYHLIFTVARTGP